jgi:hypothetical protein
MPLDAEQAEREAFQHQVETSREAFQHQVETSKRKDDGFDFSLQDNFERRVDSDDWRPSFVRRLDSECNPACACAVIVGLVCLFGLFAVVPLLSLASYGIIYPALLLDVLSASSLQSDMAYYQTHTKGTAVGTWTTMLTLYSIALLVVMVLSCANCLSGGQLKEIMIIIAAIIALVLDVITICISFGDLNVVACFRTEEAFVTSLAPDCFNASIPFDHCTKLHQRYRPLFVYFRVNVIIAYVVGAMCLSIAGCDRICS